MPDNMLESISSNPNQLGKKDVIIGVIEKKSLSSGWKMSYAEWQVYKQLLQFVSSKILRLT